MYTHGQRYKMLQTTTVRQTFQSTSTYLFLPFPLAAPGFLTLPGGPPPSNSSISSNLPVVAGLGGPPGAPGGLGVDSRLIEGGAPGGFGALMFAGTLVGGADGGGLGIPTGGPLSKLPLVPGRGVPDPLGGPLGGPPTAGDPILLGGGGVPLDLDSVDSLAAPFLLTHFLSSGSYTKEFSSPSLALCTAGALGSFLPPNQPPNQPPAAFASAYLR